MIKSYLLVSLQAVGFNFLYLAQEHLNKIIQFLKKDECHSCNLFLEGILGSSVNNFNVCFEINCDKNS